MSKKLLSALLSIFVVISSCVIYVYEELTKDPSAGGKLLVHFIDVGQADCALVEFGDFHMLIDGGNQEDGQLVISYLQQQGIEELDALVCTHAHEDHVGGLPAVLAVYPTGAIYAPTKTYASNVFDDFVRYADQQRQEIILPAPGDRIEAGELAITVLGPVKSYAETNDTSIILKLEYGETSFLFTGDMEVAAENDMLDYWGDRVDWKVDVLKVGHHGSDTSTGYRFVNALMPAYGVISVGEGNTYGHPNDEPLSRLKQAGVILLRTDKLGHVIAHSDGETVSFTWENQSAQPENVEAAAPVIYVGNKTSKRFHTEDCANLPVKENRVYFGSYDEAVQEGFAPCGSCLG